jgi:hypothetical protein
MPTPTFVPIADVTLTSSNATIQVNSIPGTYKHLYISWTGTIAAGRTSVNVSLNGDTGNAATTFFWNSGSAYGDGTPIQLSNTDGGGHMYVINYSSTVGPKSIMAMNGVRQDRGIFTFRLYPVSAAVTSFTFASSNGARPFDAGTNLRIYGLVG